MKFLIITICFIVLHIQGNTQGCVAIRSNGGSCSLLASNSEHATTHKWMLGINNRYFKSYKHFVGNEEQKERVERGTEVINKTFSTEFAITNQINSRWSVSAFVPVNNNYRSSMYEHYGNASTSPNSRRVTRSFGLGDIRLAANRWMFDPSASKGNIQLGLGLKFATGDFRYQDQFYRNDSTTVLGPVDQSIQLGDGGTGITTELNSFYRVANKLQLYANGFYLINPREQNGVSTARGGTPSATAIRYGSYVMSVPDQFMFRAGAGYSLNHFNVSAGLRVEGIPAEDLIGGSNGFRRPGYIIAAEPVISYMKKGTSFYLSVPVAVERNRIQSVPDKIRTEQTKTYFKGDAAFADYSINIGAAFALK
jgi:hypothetical protein